MLPRAPLSEYLKNERHDKRSESTRVWTELDLLDHVPDRSRVQDEFIWLSLEPAPPGSANLPSF